MPPCQMPFCFPRCPVSPKVRDLKPDRGVCGIYCRLAIRSPCDGSVPETAALHRWNGRASPRRTCHDGGSHQSGLSGSGVSGGSEASGRGAAAGALAGGVSGGVEVSGHGVVAVAVARGVSGSGLAGSGLAGSQLPGIGVSGGAAAESGVSGDSTARYIERQAWMPHVRWRPACCCRASTLSGAPTI
jgi:hypothetical protein